MNKREIFDMIKEITGLAPGSFHAGLKLGTLLERLRVEIEAEEAASPHRVVIGEYTFDEMARAFGVAPPAADRVEPPAELRPPPEAAPAEREPYRPML